MDVVVGGLVILELKAVDRIEPIHEAQLLTYLKFCALCVFAVNYYENRKGS